MTTLDSKLKLKTEMRQAFRGLLSSRDSKTNAATSDQLCQRLETCLSETYADGEGSYWAAFQPSGHEPDIRALFSSQKLKTKIKWAFPRVEGEALEFYRPTGDFTGHVSDSFVEGKWKLLEPVPAKSEKVSLDRLSGFLVPAIVFDKQCNRLGRGAGYYDRTLSDLHKTNPKAIKVGIAADLQISNEKLPVEPFDIPMDCVVTETRFFACDSSGNSSAGKWADILSERKIS